MLKDLTHLTHDIRFKLENVFLAITFLKCINGTKRYKCAAENLPILLLISSFCGNPKGRVVSGFSAPTMHHKITTIISG